MNRAMRSSRSAVQHWSGVSRGGCVRGFHGSRSVSQELKRTPLYDFHISNNAKMVPFAGYSMPLLYKNGAVAEHHATRNSAGLFDVSHMLQSRISGKDATRFLLKLTPSDVEGLSYADGIFSSTLSVLLNDKGGILDDLIITRHGQDSYYVVTNASRREHDIGWIRGKIAEWGMDVKFELDETNGLIAVQGPEAANVLKRRLGLQTDKLKFGKASNETVDGVEVHIARGGYTGEDGFELSVPGGAMRGIAEELVGNEEVQLAGLAARDSLRIEAGMCLYGQDLDEERGVVESSLSWVVGKNRRQDGDGFVGAGRVLGDLGEGVGQRRVGLVVQGAPARTGAVVVDVDGEKVVGVVTSGIPSPTLKKNIAMAYVSTGKHRAGTELGVQVRGRVQTAQVVRMPFVASRYVR